MSTLVLSDLEVKEVNGRKVLVIKINGKEYNYISKDYTPEQLKEKVVSINKHNPGGALSWLKQNASSKGKDEPDLVKAERKIKVSGDSADVLKTFVNQNLKEIDSNHDITTFFIDTDEEYKKYGVSVPGICLVCMDKRATKASMKKEPLVQKFDKSKTLKRYSDWKRGNVANVAGECWYTIYVSAKDARENSIRALREDRDGMIAIGYLSEEGDVVVTPYIGGVVSYNEEMYVVTGTEGQDITIMNEEDGEIEVTESQLESKILELDEAAEEEIHVGDVLYLGRTELGPVYIDGSDTVFLNEDNMDESVDVLEVDGFEWDEKDQIEAVSYNFGISIPKARKAIKDGYYNESQIKKSIIAFNAKDLPSRERKGYISKHMKKNNINEELSEVEDMSEEIESVKVTEDQKKYYRSITDYGVPVQKGTEKETDIMVWGDFKRFPKTGRTVVLSESGAKYKYDFGSQEVILVSSEGEDVFKKKVKLEQFVTKAWKWVSLIKNEAKLILNLDEENSDEDDGSYFGYIDEEGDVIDMSCADETGVGARIMSVDELVEELGDNYIVSDDGEIYITNVSDSVSAELNEAVSTKLPQEGKVYWDKGHKVSYIVVAVYPNASENKQVSYWNDEGDRFTTSIDKFNSKMVGPTKKKEDYEIFYDDYNEELEESIGDI